MSLNFLSPHCVLALVYVVGLRVATVTREEAIVKWVWQRKLDQINIVQYSLLLRSESGTECEFHSAPHTQFLLHNTYRLPCVCYWAMRETVKDDSTDNDIIFQTGGALSLFHSSLRFGLVFSVDVSSASLV